MISLSAAVSIILYIIIGGLIFWLLWFLINFINPPEPFKKVANVALVVLGVLVCIGFLLSFLNGVPLLRP